MMALNDACDGSQASPSVATYLDGTSAWLLDTRSGVVCLKCLRLWRLNDWTRALEKRNEETGRLPTPTPMIALLIERQIASLLAGELIESLDTAVLREIKLGTGEVIDHVLMCHPQCRDCAPFQRLDLSYELRRQHQAPLRSMTLRDIAKGPLAIAVDEAVGLVRQIIRHDGSPIASGATATLHGISSPLIAEHGYGRSGRPGDDPVIAAIEAIERYAGTAPHGREDDVVASFEELGDKAIDPTAFILHDSAQADEPEYRLQQYHPSLRYGWTRAYSFRRDATVLIPTQLAYYSTNNSVAGTGGHFVYEVSNGCAAGSTIAEAALFGLLEAIERDAFLVSWHSGRKLWAYEASECGDDSARAICARLVAEGLVVEAFDIGCGLPGASMAVAVHDPERRFDASLACAAATHIDPNRALRAALNEVATMKQRLTPPERHERDGRARELLANPFLIRGMDDHIIQGWPPEGRVAKSFPRHEALRSWHYLPLVRSDMESMPHILAEYVAKTLEHAVDVLIVDQSVAPLAARGLYCVKVLVPGLLPMTFGHSHRRLDWSRIARFADNLAHMRDDPHIFP
jgi:ribosomal protein S12 methylthiotransferase accessory factor